MEGLSKELKAFIRKHRDEDVRSLALKVGKSGHGEWAAAIPQIAGYQVARHKVPTWAECEDVLYPPHLSLEQCSSEVTARYKASLVSGDTFTDLTGGMGVDCYFLARRFRKAVYVERQPSLCDLATHNFQVLEGRHIEVHCSAAEDYLTTMPHVDWLFLDPARRDERGGKTIAIADCTPDVGQLLPLLQAKADGVMIKLSPMLDLTRLCNDLPGITSIHLLSVANECKEIVAVLSDSRPMKEFEIVCVELTSRFPVTIFRFTMEEEQEVPVTYATRPLRYLYEPSAAILKAGAFRSVAARFGVKKLHRHSHLYTSDERIAFPGRCFEVEAFSGFGKKESAAFLRGLTQANLTVRNFPASVEALRKRFRLKEGGDVYLFATTLSTDEKIWIRGRKVSFG